ncbi:ATP-binding cassette domain-containing protein [Pseudonocardia spinosispora]|uniref:ATP-binding cassette domain-containing protein n=1 Tax=Pseudonocardia spinosispora TaxID=103441 RepID=UPI0007E8EAEE|nr:ABC transporter ATP-binding protein [Pseudonocardia spinosispora]
MAADNSVHLRRVAKRYRGHTVLSEINLRLSSGEVTAILGANGCGKSTLLRIAAGITAPSQGRVLGRPRSVGYLPDRFPAQLRLSASSYLRSMGALHAREPDARVEKPRAQMLLLDQLRFTGDSSAPMSTLSKGNAQKVGLVQALCGGSGLIVLDEPWSGLDPAVAPVLAQQLIDRARAGAAVLVTDHTGLSESLPGHRLRMAEGRLTPEQITQQPGPRGDPRAELTTITIEVPRHRREEILNTVRAMGGRPLGPR